jgi:hypothetical protein
LLDVFEYAAPVDISEIERLTPRLAKAYSNLHPRTCIRDVEALEKKNFLVREGKKIRANTALIARFLPVRAENPAIPEPKSRSKRVKTSSISPPPHSLQSHDAASVKVF